jgi:hypothetical protein
MMGILIGTLVLWSMGAYVIGVFRILVALLDYDIERGRRDSSRRLWQSFREFPVSPIVIPIRFGNFLRLLRWKANASQKKDHETSAAIAEIERSLRGKP